MHCVQGLDAECEDLVTDVLAGRPSLDYLCIDGPRGPDGGPRVTQASVSGGPGGGTTTDVRVVGVRLACETDGAVAPLRGLFPTVTFHGQAAEVASVQGGAQLSGIQLGIERPAPVNEGDDLRFRVFLHPAAGLPASLTVKYTVVGVTDNTDLSDYVPQSPLEVTIPAGDIEAFVVVATNDDQLFERDERIRVTLDDTVRVLSKEGTVGGFVGGRNAREGVIVDNDSLQVSVTADPAAEGTHPAVVFEVAVNHLGTPVTLDLATADIAPVASHTATGDLACAPGSGVDYEHVTSRLRFDVGDPAESVDVPICTDDLIEIDEFFHLEWQDSRRPNRYNGNGIGRIVSVGGSVRPTIPVDYRLSIADVWAHEGDVMTFELRLTDLAGDPAAAIGNVPIDVHTDVVPFGYDYQTRLTDSGCYEIDGVGFAPCDNDYRIVDPFHTPTGPGHYDSVQSVPATPGSDFVDLQRTTVTIPDGQSSVLVEIPTVEDNIDEHFERIVIRLIAPANVDSPASLNCEGHIESDDCAVGAIIDDDSLSALAIVADRSMVEEGYEYEIELRLVDRWHNSIPRPTEKTTAWVDLFLHGYQDHWVSDYAQATKGSQCGGNVDFLAPTATDRRVEFPGLAESVRVTLHTCPDNVTEPIEELLVGVQGVYGVRTLGDELFEGQAQSKVRIQIVDPRSGQTYVQVSSTSNVTEGEDAVVDVWVAPRGSGLPLVVLNYETKSEVLVPGPYVELAEANIDYVPKSGLLVFNEDISHQTVTVQTIDNQVSERRRQFRVGLSVPATAKNVRFVNPSVAINVLDNDCYSIADNPATPPEIILDVSDGYEGTMHEVSVRSPVRLCGAQTQHNYTVRIVPLGQTSKDDIATGIRRSSLPVHQPGAFQIYDYSILEAEGYSETFSFHARDDDLDEPDEPYAALFQWEDPPYGLLDPGVKTVLSDVVYILDDDYDQSLISVDDVYGVEGERLVFTVALEPENSGPVQVDYETREVSLGPGADMARPADGCGAGADFVATDGVLEFLPGSQRETIEVQLCGDDQVDGGEEFLLELTGTDGMPAQIVDGIGRGTILDLDCVDPTNPHHPVPAISATDVTVTENALSAAVPVGLSLPFCSDQPGSLNYTVKYGTTYGTVVAADFPQGLGMSNGSTHAFGVDGRATGAEISLKHDDDGVAEGPETYTLAINWSAGMAATDARYGDAVAVEVEVTVTDDNSGLVAALTQNSPSAPEGGPVTFEVGLNRAAATDVTVDYVTEPDPDGAHPATAGVDYVALDSSDPSVDSLVIPAGARRATVAVATIADTADERDETFRLRLTGVAGATLSDDEPDHATGTIREPCVDAADPAAPAVTLTPVDSENRWTEQPGIGLVNYVFELSDLLCRGGSVEFTVGAAGGTASPGSDFVRRSGVARVPSLQRRFELGVELLDDAELEDDETVVAVLRWRPGSPQSWLDLADVRAEGTIVDDEQTGLEPVVSIAGDAEADEGQDLEFTVTLSEASNREVQVSVATHEMRTADAATSGRDFIAWTAPLTFRPGETTRTVTVRTRPDSEVEPHERFLLRLLDSPSPQGAILDSDARTAIGTIRDDECIAVDSILPGDNPPVLVFRSHDAQGEPLGVAEEGAEIHFEVALLLRMCETVHVRVGVRPGSAIEADYTVDQALLASIAIPPDGAGRFSVTAVVDDLSEVDETFEVFAHWHPDLMPPQFYDPVSGPEYSTIVTIVDGSGLPTITAAAPRVWEGGTAVFDISLDFLGDRWVSVEYATSDGSASSPDDYEQQQGTLTFWPGGDLAAQVRVPTVADFEVESTEDFHLVLSGPYNAILSEDPGGTGEMRVRAEIRDLDEARRPTGVTAASQPRGLDVAWTAPAAPVGMTGYVVRIEPAPGQIYRAPVQEVAVADPAATSVPVTGLVATVEYTVVVVAQYSDGVVAASEPASGTPSALSSAPGQPQGLTVAPDPTARARARVSPGRPVAALVSWDAPPNGEGVLFSEIQWRPVAGSYGTAARIAAGASPASIDVSRLGHTYDTRLRHWNADGPGPWTEEAGWLAAFEPDPPRNARLIPSAGSLEVIWTFPPFDGGSPVIEYLVEHRAGSSGPWTTVVVAAPALRASLSGLIDGTVYEVQLSARNAAGTSVPTATLSGTPTALPTDPVNLQMTSFKDRLEVTWDPPVNDGGSAVIDYHAQVRKVDPFGNKGPWTSRGIAVDAAARTTVVGGLSLPSDDYEVRVRAVTSSTVDQGDGPGVGPWSVTVSGSTSTHPWEIYQYQLESADSELRVSWQYYDSLGYLPITQYDIRYAKASDLIWSSLSTPGTSSTASITGLINGATYLVSVRARNSSGEDGGNGPGIGPWGNTREGVPATVPGEPTNIELTPRDGRLDAEWDAPASDGGLDITGYEVQYGNSSFGFRTIFVRALPRHAVMLSLTNGETYSVRVRALNDSVDDIGSGPGVGLWSQYVQGIPEPPVPPTEPLNVVVEPYGDRTVEVTWDPPIDDGRGLNVTYDVEWRALREGYGQFYDGVHRRVAASSESALISGLLGPWDFGWANPEYEVRVRTVNEAGVSEWSAVTTFQPWAAPGPPDDLSLFPLDNQVAVGWDAPRRDGGGLFKHYRMLAHPAGASTATEVNTNGTGLTLDSAKGVDISNGDEWRIGVSAVHYLGVHWDIGDGWYGAHSHLYIESPLTWSTVVPQAVPAVPEDVRAVAGDSRLTIEWKAPSTPAAPVRSSTLRWRVQGSGASGWNHITLWAAGDPAFTMGSTPRETSLSPAAAPGTGKTAYTLTGLDNGTVYEFAVRTSNEIRYSYGGSDLDDSDWSEISTATPAATPGAPENLTARGWIDQLRLAWDWTDSPDYPVDGFTIRWRPSMVATFDPADQATVDASARDYVVELPASTEQNAYIVEVAATNGGTQHATATVAAAPTPATDHFLEEVLPVYDTDHPWIRDAWETRRLAFETRPTLSASALHVWGFYTNSDGWPVNETTKIVVRRDLWDTQLADPLADDLHRAVVHEMAHALTLDDGNLSMPLAVLWLYHLLWLDGDDTCLAAEILAETITFNVFSSHSSAYYNECEAVGTQPTTEAAEVTADALDGNIPQWFYDRYQLPDGSMNTEAVWLDLTNPDLIAKNPAAHRHDVEVLGYAFRRFFGGYCSDAEAAESMRVLLNDDPNDDDSVTHDPWVDGGCESRLPRDVAVTGAAFSLELDWEAPLWVREPDVDAYVVQWRLESQQYSADRQIVVSGLENTSVQIGGLLTNEDYQVRIAAVDSSRPGILVDGKGRMRYVEVQGRTG